MSAVSYALFKQGLKILSSYWEEWFFGYSGGNTLLRLKCQSKYIMLIQFEFFYEWRKKGSQELYMICFFLHLSTSQCIKIIYFLKYDQKKS